MASAQDNKQTQDLKAASSSLMFKRVTYASSSSSSSSFSSSSLKQTVLTTVLVPTVCVLHVFRPQLLCLQVTKGAHAIKQDARLSSVLA
jgi:hypothetical protein